MSGTISASSPKRRSSDSSRTAAPRSRWSTAEISRSEYIAASTIGDRTDGGIAPALGEDAGEDRELAGEVRRAGHGEGEHADDEHERRERRAALGEPAEILEPVGAGALDQHRGEQEHRRRDEAVADRVEDRSRRCRGRPAEKMPSTIRLICAIDE